MFASFIHLNNKTYQSTNITRGLINVNFDDCTNTVFSVLLLVDNVFFNTVSCVHNKNCISWLALRFSNNIYVMCNNHIELTATQNQ